MTELAAYAMDAVLARFGRAGSPPPQDVRGLGAGDAALLGGAGIPPAVGPYFTAVPPGPGQPRLLGEFAAPDGVSVPPPLAGWYRLGGDRGRELCVTGDGSVRAVFARYPGEPPMPVNTSAAAFLACLPQLDHALERMNTAGPGSEEAWTAYRWLHDRVGRIDAAPLNDPESWWSRVLQDLRHTVTHPSDTAIEVTDPEAGPQIVTGTGKIAVHPEEHVWGALARGGLPPQRVTRVYTELEACDLPGHYCSMWMAGVFAAAEFTHSYPYGPDAATREAGFTALLDARRAEAPARR